MKTTPIAQIAALVVMGSTIATGQPHTAVESRTFRVPGTVVEFEVVRVELEAGPLWVLQTEVTWDLYDVYLYELDVAGDDADTDAVSRPSKPYVPPDRGMGHAGYPAMGMTRHAAESFCDWIEVTTGLDARLPTPREFEAFARLDGGAPMSAHAWTSANAERTTHPVAELAPNQFGLHDTLGNVAEWVMTEGKPVAMGGSYLDAPDACTPKSVQRQARSWNQSDPQIPKSRWWLADCSWVGFRFVVDDIPENANEVNDD
ncbi:MAG: SUMF1/EgtB/PvdO family nonheme iron enzyme [Phycisphaerales bacterium]